MTNNNAMPKAMPIAEISHILARIGILRSLHASAVANRFKLNPTEVKIMGYVKSNTLKRGVSDILDCYIILAKVRRRGRFRDSKVDPFFTNVVIHTIRNIWIWWFRGRGFISRAISW